MIEQSLLDKKRAERLKKLVTTARDYNLKKADERLFYNSIYDREEDFSEYRAKKYSYKIPISNEQLRNKDERLSEKYSKYKSPEPRVQLNKQASYIIASLFPDLKTLFRSSTGNLYSREKSYCIEKLLNNQLSNINFRSTAKKAIQLALKEGVSYLQIQWRYEKKSVEDHAEKAFLDDLAEKNKHNPKLLEQIQGELARLQMEQQKRELTGQQDEVIYDEPSVEILRANTVHRDPGAVDMQYGDFLIIEKTTTFFNLLKTPDRFNQESLKLLYEKHKNNNNFVQAETSKQLPSDTVEYAIATGKANHSMVDFKIHYYEIWEKGKLSIMTKNDEIVLDYKRQVYESINYNVIPLEHNPEAGKQGGSSVYKGSEYLIEASDEMQEMFVDQWKKHTKGRTWIHGKNTNDEKLKHRLENGEAGLFEVKDINGVKEDRIPLPDGTVYQGQKDLMGQIRSNIGTDNMVGNQNAGSNIRTDGLMQDYMQTSQVDTNENAINFAAAFKEFAKLLLKINREFLTEPQIIAYTFGNQRFFNQKPKFYAVYGEDIPRDFDIDLNLKIIADPVEAQEKAEMKELFQLAAPYPFTNKDRMFVELASRYRGYQNPFDLINPDLVYLGEVNKGQAESVGNEAKPVYFGPMSAARASEMQQGGGDPREQRPGDQRADNTTPAQRNQQQMAADNNPFRGGM